MPLYTSVSNVRRELTTLKTGVSGVVRNVNELYTGVSGVRRTISLTDPKRVDIIKDGIAIKAIARLGRAITHDYAKQYTNDGVTYYELKFDNRYDGTAGVNEIVEVFAVDHEHDGEIHKSLTVELRSGTVPIGVNGKVLIVRFYSTVGGFISINGEYPITLQTGVTKYTIDSGDIDVYNATQNVKGYISISPLQDGIIYHLVNLYNTLY